MPMISYAQNREDVLLARVFGEKPGFYIDVGAAHPNVHSVTKWFYDRGWTGINIEPQDDFYQLLQSQRPLDVNLHVAASDHNGESTLFVICDSPGCSTLEESNATSIQLRSEVIPRPTQTLTLDLICRRYADRSIDFLKIDVEGHEREVLLGANLDTWRPRVLVVEATSPNSPAPTYEKWESIVLSQDYCFAFFDGLNRYYVRTKDAALIPIIAVPPNPFDNYVLAEQVQADVTITHLREELCGLQAEVVDSSRVAQDTYERTLSELQALREQLSTTQTETLNVQQQLVATNAEANGLREHLVATCTELTGLREQLAGTRREAEGFREQSIIAVSELSALRERNALVSEEAAAFREQLLAAKSEVEAIRDQFIRSQFEVREYRDELLAAHIEIERLTDELLADGVTIGNLQANLESMTEQVNKLEAKCAATRAEFDRVRANMVKRSALDTALGFLASTRQHLEMSRNQNLHPA